MLPRGLLFTAAVAVLGGLLLNAVDQQPGNKDSGNPSVLRVDSGTLVTASGVPIRLRHVVARITPNAKCSPENLAHASGQNAADPPSFVLIDSGQVEISSDSLTRLLSGRIPGDKIHDLKVSTEGKNIKFSGKVSKGVPVPFELKGPVSATPGGQLYLKAESVKAADLPGVARLLGLDVQKVVGTQPTKGVRVEQNGLTFNPDELWGLPVHGAVKSVTVEPNGLLLDFGPGQKPNPNPHKQRHVAVHKSQH